MPTDNISSGRRIKPYLDPPLPTAVPPPCPGRRRAPEPVTEHPGKHNTPEVLEVLSPSMTTLQGALQR